MIPGFVDSHTHLVFAGDRADEFAARMAGRPYAAGGIRVTTEATRAATARQLRELARARRAEALRAGITHLEIKSGYGLDVETERRSCEVAGELTDDVTFLGAHAVPAEYEGRADDYVELVCGEMLDACAPYARWIDVFCERGAFDADQSRAVLEAGREAGLGLRVHGNQLGSGRASSSPSRWARRRSTTAPTSSDDDVEALAAGETVATFLPATDFSTREPYPDGRRAIDAGVQIAIATNCNPGLELHDLDGVLHRARCARHAPDPRRGAAGRHQRRRASAAARRHRAPGAGHARRRGRARLPVLHPPRLPAGSAARGRDGGGRAD